MIFRNINSLFIGHFHVLVSKEHLIHGFSTRQGGISAPPFDSLNLGVNTNDRPENIQTNRFQFLNTLDIPPSCLVMPQQIHEDRVVHVTRPGQIPDSDAVITNTPNCALSIQVADCVPIFLYEPSTRCIGLVHAGWRSTAVEIVKKTILAMYRHFQADPYTMYAFIGPSIGPCCYRIGPEIRHHFSARYCHHDHLNLWRLNWDQMRSVGMKASHIELTGICTHCNTRFFFSHRASGGNTGRMMAVMMLKDKRLKNKD